MLYYTLNSCVNITMSKMAFLNSSGTAILLENTAGNVSISEAKFKCSPYQERCQGIFLLAGDEKSFARYILKNGVFSGNTCE